MNYFDNLFNNSIELSKNNILGPCNQGFYGDYIFGNKPLPKNILDSDNISRGSHLGYVASNIASKLKIYKNDRLCLFSSTYIINRN